MNKVKFPCKLDISVLYQLTGRLPYEGLEFKDEDFIIHFYDTFVAASVKPLGKMVRCRTNVLYHILKGRTIIFLSGGGGGVTIFGTCRQFFQRVMRFKQFLFITFCDENNFFTTIFKKRYRLFYRSYLKKKHYLCMHTHESLI